MKILEWFIVICIAALLIIMVISAYENRHFVVRKYTVKSPKLPREFNGMKIAVLSDLHNQEFGKENAGLLSEIDEQAPDMIIGAGDLLVGRRETDFSAAVRLVEQLAGKYPFYMAMGNHEYRLRIYQEDYGEMWQSYYEQTCRAGAVWLDNETVYLQRDANGRSITVLPDRQGFGSGENQACIALTGLSVDRAYYRRLKQTPMEPDYIGRKCPYHTRDVFQILLAHNPDYFPEYAAYGADLVISGHVHGGIVRLPLLGGVISPMFTLFPKYDQGEFSSGDATMLLSAGLGSHTFKIRVNNRPELMMLTLQAV